MKKILSFDEYSSRSNESYGDNYPPGSDTPSAPWNYEGPEDNRNIDPSKHQLKLIATDNAEFAVLRDPKGNHHIYYFDASDPEFQENFLIFDPTMDDYQEPDELGIEAAANSLPETEFGFGSDDWESGEKSIVQIDQELADDLVDQFEEYKQKGTMSYKEGKKKVQDLLKMISADLQNSNESLEFGNQIKEAEGIHPAVREKLISYLKDNPDATYAEAKRFIGEKISGWKLSEEDFDEAKKLM